MGGTFNPPSWFSLNSSETVKSVTQAFCSIQEHFIRNTFTKVGIPNLPQSRNKQNSDRGTSDFQIYGHSIVNENCHNFRTSNDTDVKLGPVSKLDKRNTSTSTSTSKKKLTMTSWWQVVTLLPFFWFMANLDQSGSCNHFHNILRLFDVLPNFPFTTRVASRVAARLKTWEN